ncbi:MAG: YkgJ family cysteine cluster protein [Candidatus Omnitrophica bacterium]|nr:YkgJ family cysteine cluster protein [Candidatus Omnitrophota bacterium]
MIKQFVPQEACLNCRRCCRFSDSNSVWLPCLLNEEIESFADKPGIPAVSISADKRIVPVANSAQDGFLCPFLNTGDNKCRIYEARPFECRLYPFLINLRDRKVLLTVDLNCPYIRGNIQSADFKRYSQDLAAFLNLPEQLKTLKENPQLLQAYEEVAEVVELGLPQDEIK